MAAQRNGKLPEYAVDTPQPTAIIQPFINAGKFIYILPLDEKFKIVVVRLKGFNFALIYEDIPQQRSPQPPGHVYSPPLGEDSNFSTPHQERVNCNLFLHYARGDCLVK
ncbi:hypothetical protein NPIL_487371 [Nephila pilipes]|uniref:Uncharacterized protein n=1 Tax=Nephila pilipes TaxID=299642 RepID=A0A8X6MP54_NEPPI|nr:hypothetical protein NPIL_487371 [Nephila pilipes]